MDAPGAQLKCGSGQATMVVQGFGQAALFSSFFQHRLELQDELQEGWNPRSIWINMEGKAFPPSTSPLAGGPLNTQLRHGKTTNVMAMV